MTAPGSSLLREVLHVLLVSLFLGGAGLVLLLTGRLRLGLSPRALARGAARWCLGTAGVGR